MRIPTLKVVSGVTFLLCTVFTTSAQTQPLPVRSRQIELHYQVDGAGESAQVELWYTRDRGATWQQSDRQTRGGEPLIFEAPDDGLYGFVLIVRDGQRASRSAPQADDLPEQWVFVDATAPLLEFTRAEPGPDFARRPMLLLKWSAHDDHFDSRPISLDYQTDGENTWQATDETLPNTGAYDWPLPSQVKGSVKLRLTARDRGGNMVERVLGPVKIERGLLQSSTTQPAVTLASSTQPASDAATTRPAGTPYILPPDALADPTHRDRAREICQRGNKHLARGQYAMAAERFQEALELDPQLTDALNALAGICYLQKNFDAALKLYRRSLDHNSQSRTALRGLALAYVGTHDYPESRKILERLLAAFPTDAESRLDLGDVLFLMGDTSGARERWQHVAKQGGIEAKINAQAQRRLEVYGVQSGAADQLADSGRK